VLRSTNGWSARLLSSSMASQAACSSDAGGLGGAGDRALFGDMLQQGDALGAAGDVLGEQGGQGHGQVSVVRKMPDVAARTRSSQA
jgi:hypothetical protein